MAYSLILILWLYQTAYALVIAGTDWRNVKAASIPVA